MWILFTLKIQFRRGWLLALEETPAIAESDYFCDMALVQKECRDQSEYHTSGECQDKVQSEGQILSLS